MLFRSTLTSFSPPPTLFPLSTHTHTRMQTTGMSIHQLCVACHPPNLTSPSTPHTLTSVTAPDRSAGKYTCGFRRHHLQQGLKQGWHTAGHICGRRTCFRSHLPRCRSGTRRGGFMGPGFPGTGQDEKSQ